MNWEKEFERIGAFKFHSGNPKDPYFLLTSGKISNGFFDAGIVFERDPYLLRRACKELCRKVHPSLIEDGTFYRPCVISVALGGIPITAMVGAELHGTCKIAEKEGDEVVFKRGSKLSPTDRYLFADDVFTEGTSFKKLERAILKQDIKPHFFDVLLVLCNRSGLKEFEGRGIISLVERNMPRWDMGKNPFTPDGKELVPPIHAKLAA